MAKARMLRPDFWTDERVVSVSPLARLLFQGMWTYACDNGHVDDSTLQLKIRVLPGDDCDIAALLGELLATGMVVRENGYLKVVNLSKQQPLDLRFLVFCDHCENDIDRHYHAEDKKGNRRAPKGGTRDARVQPASDTTGAQRSGDGDGDGDGDGKRTARRLPTAWKPNQSAVAFATEHKINLEIEVEKFCNHHGAKGSKFIDWDRAFRTWLRNAEQWAKPSTGASAPFVTGKNGVKREVTW